MNCIDAKQLIHLDVGDDLRADEKQQLTGHTERCAECRDYYARMAGAMSALLSLRGASSVESDTQPVVQSVWPSISRVIICRRTTPAANRKFNLKVAALSVCSLSLAVVTIVQSLSSMRESSGAVSFVPAQSVVDQLSGSGSWQRPGDNSPRGNVPSFPHAFSELAPQSF